MGINTSGDIREKIILRGRRRGRMFWWVEGC